MVVLARRGRRRLAGVVGRPDQRGEAGSGAAPQGARPSAGGARDPGKAAVRSAGLAHEAARTTRNRINSSSWHGGRGDAGAAKRGGPRPSSGRGRSPRPWPNPNVALGRYGTRAWVSERRGWRRRPQLRSAPRRGAFTSSSGMPRTIPLRRSRAETSSRAARSRRASPRSSRPSPRRRRTPLRVVDIGRRCTTR